MSKAYRCDVCGKFCSDCYEINGFDIYPDDYAKEVIQMLIKRQ